jgi:pilus assembly protein Flp/PilA
MTRRFLQDETGATAIEYAVIAALIFMVILASIVPVGQALTGIFNGAAVPLEAAAGAAG